jgi:hypothetical protein
MRCGRSLRWQVEVCYRPGLTPLPRRLHFKGTPIEGRDDLHDRL